MGRITIDTHHVSSYLAIQDAKDSLVKYIVESTKGRLPPDSSDSVDVRIEAVLIRRILAAVTWNLDERLIACSACHKPIPGLTVKDAQRGISHFHKRCRPLTAGVSK